MLDLDNKYDVCVVGSGPAGTIISKILVENKIKTIMIEAGKGMAEWLFNPVYKKNLADFEVSGNANYPVENTRGMLLGGTSNFWTGRCERLHHSDFEVHPYTPVDNHWPINYNDLQIYYERAEELLRVRGNERYSDIPIRRKPLPYRSNLNISILKDTFKEIGVIVDDSPTATPTKFPRFFLVQKEILNGYRKSSSFKLIDGAIVTRIITDSKRNIVGIKINTTNGEEKIAKAKIFIIACGGIATPRLLLLSKSETFPEGIGNHYDRVGRGFNEHPALNFFGQIPHSFRTLSLTNKIGRTHQYYTHFRSEGLGSILPVFRQSWIFPHHNMPVVMSRIPHNALAILRRLCHASIFIGATIEMEISDENRVTLSKNKKDIFGDPLAHLILNYGEKDLILLDKTRKLIRDWFENIKANNVEELQITFSRHHQGTCRMGDNPATSVVDKNLRVHETSNLYLCGGEVFVTGGAMQPALTISALALRLGEHISTKLKSGE